MTASQRTASGAAGIGHASSEEALERFHAKPPGSARPCPLLQALAAVAARVATAPLPSRTPASLAPMRAN
jgi:hypothetical protein